VTDGTTAGTTELKVAGQYPVLEPNHFAVFGNKALFGGKSAPSGYSDLWVTDGTAAGTSALTHVSGFQLQPTDITVFGSKALFDGAGNLWVTDGTAARTSQANVAGVFSAGLFFGFTPDFTVLGTKVVFTGDDASGFRNLWVTDGTSIGTSELRVIGANARGLNPNGFAVLGSKALFDGLDANGSNNLWATDGTSAGTSQPTVTGVGANGVNPHSLMVLSQRGVHMLLQLRPGAHNAVRYSRPTVAESLKCRAYICAHQPRYRVCS